VDSARRTEVELLSAPAAEGGSDIDEFYVRLKRIQDHHARYPNQDINGIEIELANIMENVDEVENEEYELDDRQFMSTYDPDTHNNYFLQYSNQLFVLWGREIRSMSGHVRQSYTV
jgi:splicing factor 3A subunit 3